MLLELFNEAFDCACCPSFPKALYRIMSNVSLSSTSIRYVDHLTGCAGMLGALEVSFYDCRACLPHTVLQIDCSIVCMS